MTRVATLAAIPALVAIGIAGVPSPAVGQVSVGITIGPPPPPPVIVAPPPVAVVESAPVYFYGGRYFRYYNSGWYVAPGYEGPWRFVPAGRVPPRVLALPGAYNRLPPGHIERVGPHPWARAERAHERGGGRDHERERGRGPERK